MRYVSTGPPLVLIKYPFVTDEPIVMTLFGTVSAKCGATIAAGAGEAGADDAEGDGDAAAAGAAAAGAAGAAAPLIETIGAATEEGL